MYNRKLTFFHHCPSYIILMILSCWFSLSACDDESKSNSASPDLKPIRIRVNLPEEMNRHRTALEQASLDLSDACLKITGDDQTLEGRQIVVRVELDEDLIESLGQQGYRINTENSSVIVQAGHELGATYGLYHIAGDLGARYIHPEQSIFPQNQTLTLPNYQDLIQTPHFERRGFHEHTQHPIVMSEFMLKAGQQDYRTYVSHYLRWLLRNRQNTLSFHMLNTVDLETWIPYLSEITSEAKELGISVGFVTGFVDQQQNAFRLVMPDDPRPAEQQIIEKLDLFASTGIGTLGLQLGTSEFTKPDESLILDWLNLATAHLAMTQPELSLFAWIHITCDLYQENGTPFYHLPLAADERLGALVHTTMFYTIDHPAPVYDCENFTHQREFLDQANQQREQVFFPETAWWLGFDNNVPLVNPITGLSREYDILEALPTWDINGHITFTTGKEWTYWQYDHYLSQVTWLGKLTWSEYLTWLSPIYGEHAQSVVNLIEEWGQLQWTDLYETNPEIYFYLAGELPQDELGEQAGVIARPPKQSFRKILELDDVSFSRWQNDDFKLLQDMLQRYQQSFEVLAEPDTDSDALYLELHHAYLIFILRIQHAIELYSGVIAVRNNLRDQAEQHLSETQKISEQALKLIHEVEADYRYPLDLLIKENPDSLTAYPFGYLHETSSAYFWLRRETQLQQLIKDVFEAAIEEWFSPPKNSIYLAQGESLSLLAPISPVLQGALSGFVAQLLLAESELSPENLARFEEEQSSTDQLLPRAFTLAQDYNTNLAPDPNTQQTFIMNPIDELTDSWLGDVEHYSLLVRDASGLELGQITIHDLKLTLLPTRDTSDTEFKQIKLSGTVTPDEVITLVTSVAGIEPAALAQLIKNIWRIETSADLPEQLPIELSFDLETP